MAQEQDRIAHGASDPSVPPPYPQTASSAQIRRDIDRTRAEMDETVDVLEERLRPRHLLDDLLDFFRGSSASQSTSQTMSGTGDQLKQVGAKVLDRIKSNPMPAALIGAGIAWLLVEDDSRRQGRGDEAGSRGTTGPGITEKAKGMASGAAESARESASSAGAKIYGQAASTRESMSGTAQSMREYASAASGQAQRGYDASRHYMERGLDEYPLAMGAAAAAVGVLAGWLLPSTRTEDTYLGEASDQVKDRTREAGQNIASATAGAAREETGRQGAQPGELGEKIRRVAEDVTKAAGESARREGIDPQSLKGKAQSIGQRTREAAEEESQRQTGQQGH